MTTARREGLHHIAEAVARHYGITFEHFQLHRSREAAEARRTALLVMSMAVPDATSRQMGDAVGLRWPRNEMHLARRDAVARLEADVVLRRLQG